MIGTDEAAAELIEAVDHLAKAGNFDRSRVARGLAALVRRRASFEALRFRFDPRFGDVPPLQRGDRGADGVAARDRQVT